MSTTGGRSVEKCPLCGNFTYAYDRINDRFICLNLSCSCTQSENSKEYKREKNILNKLTVKVTSIR